MVRQVKLKEFCDGKIRIRYGVKDLRTFDHRYVLIYMLCCMLSSLLFCIILNTRGLCSNGYTADKYYYSNEK